MLHTPWGFGLMSRLTFQPCYDLYHTKTKDRLLMVTFRRDPCPGTGPSPTLLTHHLTVAKPCSPLTNLGDFTLLLAQAKAPALIFHPDCTHVLQVPAQSPQLGKNPS